MRILIVEDDIVLLDGLKAGLGMLGATVDTVECCADCLEALSTSSFDAIVLDVMLPDGSGLDLLQQLRSKGNNIPILLLTALDDVGDRIRGLDSGADDYLGKPFDLEELGARVRAIVRRKEGRGTPTMSHNGVVLDPGALTVSVNSSPVQLSRREFAVLETLLERPGLIRSKNELEERLYGWQEEVESNAIEVHIHNFAQQNRSRPYRNSTRNRLPNAVFEVTMVRSIRGRLFVVLVTATAFIWLCASAWIFLQTRNEVEHVLDTRLQEAARMVSSLAISGSGSATALSVPDEALAQGGGYERQLSCQIWSLDGRLMARSSGAPSNSLSGDADGFSDRLVDGETWRVYAVSDAQKNIRVLVGDRIGLRERLVSDLIRGLLWPAIFIVPLLGFLIWGILGRGLRPLQTMAADLTRRSVDDLSPLNVSYAPPELAPLANSLNGLFMRVDAVRRHERDFTAFAAHELRTPIAGLKLQAQVAIGTKEAAQRDTALQNIVLSVDRITRLSRQLLTVARLDAERDEGPIEEVDVHRVIAEIVSEMPAKPALRVTLQATHPNAKIKTSRDLLAIALRNLHENAVNHSNGPGEIVWSATSEGSIMEITVTDNGPGIPNAEMHLVRSRFFRGRHKSASGSGLGLAIVDIALERIHGSLKLINREDVTGLKVVVRLPTAEPAIG